MFLCFLYFACVSYNRLRKSFVTPIYNTDLSGFVVMYT